MHTRHTGVQKCLVLEEVEMPPAHLLGVVCRAVRRAAAGACKPAAGGEVDVDVELTRLGVELAADDRPWRYQPQRQLQQAGVAHGHFLRTRARPLKPGAVLAAVKDAARRFAVACGHP